MDPANVYAAWDYDNKRCTCATNAPLASQVEANGTAVVPEQIDTCGPNYEVLVTHTTWQFKECSNEYQWTSTGVYNSQADFAGIFALCKNYPLMAIWPVSWRLLETPEGKCVSVHACQRLRQRATSTIGRAELVN